MGHIFIQRYSREFSFFYNKVHDIFLLQTAEYWTEKGTGSQREAVGTFLVRKTDL